MVMVTLLLVIVGNASAVDSAKFDPEKPFVAIGGSAIMGDAAIYTNLASGLTGGTVITTFAHPTIGLILNTSMIEPRQNNNPGGIHALQLKPQEAAKLINLLRKGPTWANIATENNVSDYSKIVGVVRGEVGTNDAISVVFVVSSDNKMSMQLEHQITKSSKRFQFGIVSAQKFSNQLLHFLATISTEFAPENPEGDAEKDKLFN